MNKGTSYKEVGTSVGLKGERLELYVWYMETRWKEEEGLHCATYYAEEWAQRFLRGDEFACSDGEGERLLKIAEKQRRNHE